MDTKNNDTSIAGHIFPALRDVRDPLLREPLESAFRAEAEALHTVESCFRQVTGDYQSPEKLKYFFKSWSMTNNSAMCVSGLGNRITMQIRGGVPVEDADALLQAVTSLHRISDEDLGVGNGLLHWDLYYRMATSMCESDDWQSKRYLTAEAESFKRWKDECALRHEDLMMGLLTTLVHEVYTHGEVEYVEPMFQAWLAACSDFSDEERRRNLFWITVHCNGTETRHFGHAQDATAHYCRGHGIDLRRYDLESVFRDYLRRKAAVMASVSEVLSYPRNGRMVFGSAFAAASA